MGALFFFCSLTTLKYYVNVLTNNKENKNMLNEKQKKEVEKGIKMLKEIEKLPFDLISVPKKPTSPNPIAPPLNPVNLINNSK